MWQQVAPGGYGPWFCGFLVNTGKDPKKHTHVVAHTMPHLIVDALNQTAANQGTNDGACWILVLKIGPFIHWKDSVAFLQHWLTRTRGIVHRIERGIELYCQYREQYALYLWSQTRNRDDAIAYWRALTPWCPAPLVAEPLLEGTGATASATAVPAPDKQMLFRQWLETRRDFVHATTSIEDLRTFQKGFVLNNGGFLFCRFP